MLQVWSGLSAIQLCKGLEKHCNYYMWTIITDSWSIVQCQANSSVNINEDQCEEIWQKNEQYHDIVKFNTNPKEEIYVSYNW